MYKVYVLINPITDKVFYVGYTKDILLRYAGHIREAWSKPESEKSKIIKECILTQKPPIIRVVQSFSTLEEAIKGEKFFISEIGNSFYLVNKTTGGLGTPGCSHISINKKGVSQIDMITLQVVNQFDSIENASLVTGVSASCINTCCNKKRYSAKKFFWCFTNEVESFIPLTQFKKGEHKKLPVLQLDLNGNIIKGFTSLSEAAEITGVNITKICAVCNNTRNTAGNYKWTYKK